MRPPCGVTSTSPAGLGCCSRMVMVADLGKESCLAVSAPVVVMMILLFNLTAFRGAGNSGQRKVPIEQGVALDPAKYSRSGDFAERIGWRACGRRGRRRFPRCRQESTGRQEPE